MSDLTDAERLALMQRYQAAAHAMQSGVAMMMVHDSKSLEPKHLRVGINAAMADQGGLARLLIAKGLITEREYLTAMCEGMERERDSYTDAVQAVTGTTKVSLG